MAGELRYLGDIEAGARQVCQSKVAQRVRAEARHIGLTRQSRGQQTPREASEWFRSISWASGKE